MKDELFELLGNDSLDEEVMVEIEEESQCQELAIIETPVPPDQPNKKISEKLNVGKR